MSEGETQQVAFRMPVDLVKQLDEYARRMRAEAPGWNATRADAARVLLARALEQAGKKER